MGKTIIAFVAGLAVATLAFSLFNNEPASTSLEPSGSTSSGPGPSTPSREGVDTSDPSAEGESRDSIPNEARTDAGSEEFESLAASGDQASANESPPPGLPIELPPEFDWLAESSFHRALERERYDPNWAPGMEAQLMAYLSENPKITQDLGYPTITCRTRRCELAFASYGLEELLGDVDYLVPYFVNSTSGFWERPEFEEFNDDFRARLDFRTEDGVTAMIWELILSPED